MYLLKAGENYSKYGEIFGQEIINGEIRVRKQYWWQFLRQHGFEDVTPDHWLKSKGKPDDINRVLHIHYSGIGDILFVSPIFKAFHKKYKQKDIPFIQHLATGQHAAKIICGNPFIKGFFLNEMTGMPHYIDQYDDVISYDCMIAGNKKSETVNAYDIVSEWSGVELNDDEKKPDIYFYKQDIFKCDELMKKWDMAYSDKTVLIQYESSSKLRSPEVMKFVELAIKLRDEGYKPILFGQQSLNHFVFYYCKGCNQLEGIQPPHGTLSISHKCSCGTINEIDCSKIGIPGIYFYDSGKYTIRTAAVLIASANYFIGPDSCGNHIAGAFDIPQVGLYSSFLGDLRMRYYYNARWLQKPFKECSPCFYHKAKCKMMSKDKGFTGGMAPCMQNITVDDMYSEFKKLEQGEYMTRKKDIKTIKLEAVNA